MTTAVLITGGTGLIGTRLTEKLLQKSYRVSHLGRERKVGLVPSFVWNVSNATTDERALSGVDAIIHLAGAGVADERWTPRRKREILESRTKSTALLHKTLESFGQSVKVVVSASAIGYYGGSLDPAIVDENGKPGDDYLAKVVAEWERAVDSIGTLGIRIVKIRTGIVLSGNGGALKEMAAPVKWGVGAALGTGKQLMSWIHIDDLCDIFVKAVEDSSMSGAYNAVAPSPVTNKELTRIIAKVLNRPLWLPPIPAFALRLLVGEIADLVTTGRHVTSAKIQQAGFKFQFPGLEVALCDLLTPMRQRDL